MKVALISMPDVIPIVIHEMALHMPNHGIACIGGNVDTGHEVYLIDLVRKRRSIAAYLTKTLKRIHPDLVGLSAMTWQFPTCLAVIRLIKSILPQVKIAIGGYHATLMSREIAASPESDAVDFIIRGEGEEPFRRLVNALAGTDQLEAIPSLSRKQAGGWIHNEAGALCDLSRLKLPIRDRRRLTGGYHFMYSGIEVMEFLQHQPYVRTFLPDIPHRAHPRRSGRYLFQPENEADLYHRRQYGPGSKVGHERL
jgi:anaerobic magnesium-protoporphyrin IX monomethyl ester cyclase